MALVKAKAMVEGQLEHPKQVKVVVMAINLIGGLGLRHHCRLRLAYFLPPVVPSVAVIGRPLWGLTCS